MKLMLNIKSVTLALPVCLILGCGGGSSFDNLDNLPDALSFSLVNLVDNGFSYTEQNITIDTNYPNCEFRIFQESESPKILHIRSTNNQDFSFRNPIIYTESASVSLQVESIPTSDCPNGSREVNFNIRKYPTEFLAVPDNPEDLDSRLFQVNDIGFGGIIITERFTATICYPTPEDCQSYINELFGQDAHNMATGDFNGDGYEDLAVAWAAFPHTIEQEKKFRAPINIYLNDGNGHFSEDKNLYATGNPPTHPFAYRLIVEDFNDDGMDDLFAGSMGIQVRKENYNENYIDPYPHLLLLSNQDLKLEESNQNIIDDNNGSGMLCGFAHDASAGDVDGDGDIDIYACNILMINNGEGQFNIHPYINFNWQQENKYGNPMSSLVEDLNNDGFDDLLFWNFDNRSNWTDSDEGYILLSNDSSNIENWEQVTLPPGPFGYDHNKYNHAASGDLNGDGYKDVAIAITRDDPYYEGVYIQILLNNGNGELIDETPIRFPDQPRRESHHGEGNIYIRDLNLDGHLDIIHSTRDYQSGFHGANIAINDGSGYFESLNESDLPMRPDPCCNDYDYLMKGVPIDADNEACLDLISVTDPGFGSVNETENYLFTIISKNCEF